jgi:HNH endonuclease
MSYQEKDGQVIPLTRGMHAVVDSADFEKVSGRNWYAHKGHRTYYACAWANGTIDRMHHVILGVPSTVLVDHADGNGLNNCRSNLRLATKSLNGANRRKQRNNTTGYMGVVKQRNKKRELYMAMIECRGKQSIRYGFSTPEGAARARDAMAMAAFGEFATLNFPRERLNAGNPNYTPYRMGEKS